MSDRPDIDQSYLDGARENARSLSGMYTKRVEACIDDTLALCDEVERLRGVIRRATEAWESPDDVQEVLESALEEP